MDMVFKYGMETTTGQSKTLHSDGHSVCLVGILYSPVTLHAGCQPPRWTLIPLTGPFRRVPKQFAVLYKAWRLLMKEVIVPSENTAAALKCLMALKEIMAVVM
jgi:hypothetical protein